MTIISMTWLRFLLCHRQAAAALCPWYNGSRASQKPLAVQVVLEEHTCEATIVIPLDTPTLLMQEIAERVAVSTMLRDTPGK